MAGDHPELADDLAAYVLGAMDAEEALEVEAHLATCAECQAQLAAHRSVVPPLPPAPEVPSRVWDRVREAADGHGTGA